VTYTIISYMLFGKHSSSTKQATVVGKWLKT